MDLDAAAKRRFHWIVGALIATAAYFQALGMSHLIAITILQSGAGAPSAPHLAARPRILPDDVHVTKADAILERNPFDSTTGPLVPLPDDEPEPPPPAADRDPLRDPPCDAGRVVLIAVSDDASWSFAVIEGPDGHTQLWRLGGDAPGGTIERISWDRVWLTSGNARCQMRLGKGGDPPPPPSSGPVPQARPAVEPPFMNTIPPEIAARIRRTSATEFQVDRAAVDMLLEQQALLMRSARVIPERRGGEVVGLKLRIKPGSMLESLGLQSGDSLRSINGFDITDPQKALEAYARLRTADRLSVAIEREGRPMTIDFNIR